jgi:hypothetical protein
LGKLSKLVILVTRTSLSYGNKWKTNYETQFLTNSMLNNKIKKKLTKKNIKKCSSKKWITCQIYMCHETGIN